MLRILRENASSWMLRGILILVAVTFISWGGYSLIRERKQTYAAKVNGVAIEIRDFSDTYQNVIKQYRDALGPSFSEKMVEELHLREKVLNDLVSRVLILQEAARLGFDIHDEELRESIESIPSFQVNGRFDSRIYERFLRLNRMSGEDFERMQREGLMLSKLTNLIKLNGGKVSEEEVLETYLFENERINLTFLKVTPEIFKGQTTVNEVEIKDYFQKHQEEFRVPTFLQIQYLIFRLSEFEGKVQVSSDEIKRYYDLQKERFKIPKKVRVREILIKVSAEDPTNKIEEKTKKAEEILEKAKKTKDFGSLAKQYSESNTAPKGGDMGWIPAGTVDESFEKILFSRKAGELSGVVRGKDGFYIFKIEDAVEEKLKSLEEVKDQILQTLKKEKARGEASHRADDAFYSLFRSRDLEGFGREKDLPIKTTGFFKEGDEIPEIGKNPSFYSSAFSLKVGEISPVVSVPPNFYILKLLDKKDSRIPSLEEVKEEVGRKVIGMKCEEKARQVAEDLLGQIRAGKSMKEVAKDRGIQMNETGLFTRAGGLVPKIGPAEEFTATLSSLTEKGPFPKEVFRTKDGYFVVKLSGLEPADQSKFPSVKKDLQKRIIYQK
ncbi:MAG: SurA N-terminal domain-containing protein, partial [Desulfobacterales bacterium]|nr:SurA N-terminal domain-containing protein [Desulfobacterales bacterium]